MHIYRLKITLKGITPPIWRCVEVPDTYTLNDLHHIIQEAMGWYSCHLHLFEIDGQTYTEPYEGELDEDYAEDLDDRKYKLAKVLGGQPGYKFLYTYDFGDGWDHQIVLEAISTPDKNIQYPRCIKGKRACPPEDCGGTYGYFMLLDALKNPNAKSSKELLEWAEDYDPEVFSLEDTNRMLGSVFKNGKFDQNATASP